MIHTRYQTAFPVLLVLTLSLFSCAPQGEAPGARQLARVGDEYLTVDMALERIPGEMVARDSLRMLQSYRDEWVQEKLLLQEAERLQLAQNPDVARKLRQAEQEVLKESLKDLILARYDASAAVTDEEARNYFQTYKNQFILNERYVRFRHMQTRTIEDARAAKRELLRGIEWPVVAHRYGLQPERSVAESEQFWPISMAAKEFEQMNRFLRVIGQMEISPIEQVNGSFQFVQLIDSRAEGEHPDLDWLIGQIKEWLLLEKRRRHFSSYIKNLYLKAESNNEIDNYDIFPTNLNSNQYSIDTLESDLQYE